MTLPPELPPRSDGEMPLPEQPPQPEPEPSPPAGSIEMTVTEPIEPELVVAGWMHSISQYPVGSAERYYADQRLRHQIARVYGRQVDETGRIVRQRDLIFVESKARALGQLLAPELHDNPEAERRVFDAAYEFASLVHDQAYTADKTYNDAWQATHDPLTKMLNRRGLADKLEEAIRRARRGTDAGLALLYMDLDEFKALNDTYGHDFGDAILTGVSAKIDEHTRDNDIVARAGMAFNRAERGRLGGDEFVVLVSFANDDSRPHPSRMLPKRPKSFDARAKMVVERLEEVIEAYLHYQTGGTIAGVGVSVGHVIWQKGMSADELLRLGDYRMYQVKRRRKRQRGPGNEEA